MSKKVHTLRPIPFNCRILQGVWWPKCPPIVLFSESLDGPVESSHICSSFWLPTCCDEHPFTCSTTNNALANSKFFPRAQKHYENVVTAPQIRLGPLDSPDVNPKKSTKSVFSSLFTRKYKSRGPSSSSVGQHVLFHIYLVSAEPGPIAWLPLGFV